MNVQPICTAVEAIRRSVFGLSGAVVSVKAAIAAAREECPSLKETDQQLEEHIVSAAAIAGRAVLFDLHE
jgi:hypothetical protein